MAGRRNPLTLITVCLVIVLAALVIAQARLVIDRDGNFYPDSTVPVGSDLLVFYSAGRIVADGDGRDLYQPSRQEAEQWEILGEERGLAIFPYPAFVAAAYATVAGLSLPFAYVVVTLAMIAATIGTILLLRSVSPTVHKHPLLVTLTLLISQPFNMALFGGQTVAFSLLCLTGVYVGFRRERHLFLGFWLGLLLYKPQLALLPIVILLWQRRWRSLAMTGAVGVMLFAIGVAAAGLRWPFQFLDLATSDYYRDNAIVVDGIQSISIPSFLRYVTGTDALWSQGVALVLCLGLVAGAGRYWRAINTSDARFPILFGGTVAVMILVSPHALFYEAGLLALPVIAIVDGWKRPVGVSSRLLFRQRLIAIAGLIAIGFLFPLAGIVRFEPLLLAPIVIGALCWRQLRNKEASQVRQSHQSVPSPLVPARWD